MDQMKGIVRLLGKEKDRLTEGTSRYHRSLSRFWKGLCKGYWQTESLR
jgi:hypothetical protein